MLEAFKLVILPPKPINPVPPSLFMLPLTCNFSVAEEANENPIPTLVPLSVISESPITLDSVNFGILVGVPVPVTETLFSLEYVVPVQTYGIESFKSQILIPGYL